MFDHLCSNGILFLLQCFRTSSPRFAAKNICKFFIVPLYHRSHPTCTSYVTIVPYLAGEASFISFRAKEIFRKGKSPLSRFHVGSLREIVGGGMLLSGDYPDIILQAVDRENLLYHRPERYLRVSCTSSASSLRSSLRVRMSTSSHYSILKALYLSCRSNPCSRSARRSTSASPRRALPTRYHQSV